MSSKCATCRTLMADKYGYVCTGDCKNNKSLRKAFHKLALKHHPDKGGDEQEFKTITECHRLIYEEGCKVDVPKKQEAQKAQEEQEARKAEEDKFAYQYASNDTQPEFPPMSARERTRQYQAAMHAAREAEKQQRDRHKHWQRAQLFKERERAALRRDIKKRAEESRFRDRVFILRQRLRPQTKSEIEYETYLYQKWRQKQKEFRNMPRMGDVDSSESESESDEEVSHWWEESDDDEEESPSILMRVVLGVVNMLPYSYSDSDEEY